MLPLSAVCHYVPVLLLILIPYVTGCSTYYGVVLILCLPFSVWIWQVQSFSVPYWICAPEYLALPLRLFEVISQFFIG